MNSEDHTRIRSESLTLGDFSISTAQYQPTERPIEDRYSFHSDPNSKRIIVGVYDGHGGTSTAEHVSQHLPVSLLNQPPNMHVQVFEEFDNLIMSKFIKDHSIFRSKSDDWVENAEIVKSGCTALVLDVDTETMIASYANAGDCRFVVCKLGENNDAIVRYESSDLNAKTPSEQERLRAEHPGEELLIVSGRLFGRLMCTRGFGDGYYKLPCSGFMGKKKHKQYIDILSSIEREGKVPLNAQYNSYFYGYQTPPYISARPEIGSLQLEPEDVVIMATDGLWDKISSQGAASVVLGAQSQGIDNIATHLVRYIRETKPPGDDVTVIVFVVRLTCN